MGLIERILWKLGPAVLRELRPKVAIEIALEVLKIVPKMLARKLAIETPQSIRIYPRCPTIPDRTNPRPNADLYSFSLFAPTFHERKQFVLDLCIQRFPGFLMGEAAQACHGVSGFVHDDIIDAYIRRLDERLDCTDFFCTHILHALFINCQHPFLTDQQVEALKQGLLRFKYWIDEPGFNEMIMWTENHQIMFHACEHLAGVLFPSEKFLNNGKDGRWRQAHAKQLILQWIGRRARWGFNEWNSNEYFAKDLEALLLLAEYSPDSEVARYTAMMTDVMLVIIGCDMFQGFHASTHGRSYEDENLSGRDYDLAPLVKLVWGHGTFAKEGMMAALVLASAKRYQPAAFVFAIGEACPDMFWSLERNGFPLEKARDFGLNPKSLRDIVFFWGMGAVTNTSMLDTFVRACDAWNLWNQPFFDVMGNFHKLLPRRTSLGNIMKGMDIDSDRTLLGEVNKVTYRTPDYMMSTAQDYRPGQRGNQHHIWQATLSPDALTFTTNPGAVDFWKESLSPDKLGFTRAYIARVGKHWNRTPGYWTGENHLPRAVQYKNVGFIIYNINTNRALGERPVLEFTHAFFPRWAFEEVTEAQGWIFGRVKQGYLALFSTVPYTWKEPADPFTHDVIAPGRRNIWICHCGNNKQYGGFRAFQDAILHAPLKCDLINLSVTYNAPEVGQLTFSWKGSFLHDGELIPLRNYKRIDNNFCTSAFNTGIYHFRTGVAEDRLDFSKL